MALRLRLCVLAVTAAFAQQPDPAYAHLEKAYAAGKTGAYEQAVTHFLKAAEAAPGRASIRKDLAYTYLKIGESEAAREQFAEAARLDPNDFHAALEHAFLCYETGERALARRIFDRVRQSGDPASRATAEQAFQNIDRPLAEGIARWRQALALNPGDFSSHVELARLAEQRDAHALAAEHYEQAWRMRPQNRGLLVDLGRVRKALGQAEEANAALLAAARGAEPHAAERARELLPDRYPYVYEFRLALQLDSDNVELRREVAYLLLEMKDRSGAEQQFRAVTEQAPGDLLSAAQLGFLRLARGDLAGAMPLLERVLKGNDEELADRVRAALGQPQTLRRRPETPRRKISAEARVLAERSYQAGYLRDALKYFEIAHEIDPADFAVMLKLGWTNNVLGQDRTAAHWFDLARHSPDPAVAAEAARAWRNLRDESVRATAWLLPFYSSRWRDVFTYGQLKTELFSRRFPVRPYLSMRFVGDTRRTTGGAPPQYLSESSLIFGAGLATRGWRGLTLWGEAGTAASYLRRQMVPDYRAGAAYGKGFGPRPGAARPGRFFETEDDAVFLSRFGDDLLLYSRNRFGYTVRTLQFYLNAHAAADARREYWANFVECGPGVRLLLAERPAPLIFSVDLLRGAHTMNRGNPRRPNYFDLRAGFWYAFTR